MRSICIYLNLALLFLFCCCGEKKFAKPDIAFDERIDSIANVLATSDRMPEAFRLLDSVYAIPAHASLPGILRKYNIKIRQLQIIEGKNWPPSALQYLDSMFYLFEHHHKEDEFPELYAQPFLYRGDYYVYDNNYDSGFYYYSQALNWMKKGTDSAAVWQVHSRMGQILYDQKKYREAVPEFLSAFDNLSRNRHQNSFTFNTLQVYLGNVVSCYMGLGLADSALPYAFRQLHFIEDFAKEHPPQLDLQAQHYQRATSVAFGNLSAVHWKLANLDSSKYYIYKNIEFLKHQELKDRYLLVPAQARLLQILIKERKFTAAKLALNELSRLTDRADPERYLTFLRMRSMYFKAAGEKDSLYANSNMYTDLKDSLLEKQRKLLTLNVTDRIESNTRQYKIDLLTRQQTERNRLVIALIIILSLVACLAYFIFKGARKSKITALRMSDLNGKLQVSLKEQERVLKIVAHDLHNPISVIALIADNVMEETDLPPRAAKKLSRVKRAAHQSIELVEELLRDQKVPFKQIAQNEPTDLNSVLQEVGDFFSEKADLKQIALSVHLPQDKVSVAIGYNEIFKVVSYIVSNAIKFSYRRGTVELILDRNETSAIISVVDHGIGIPPDIVASIFELRSSVGRSGTEGESSYGIGLYVCKQIVEAHGGKVQAVSIPERSTSFSVVLPL